MGKKWSETDAVTHSSASDKVMLLQSGANVMIELGNLLGKQWIGKVLFNSGTSEFEIVVGKNDFDSDIAWALVNDGGFDHWVATLAGAFPNDRTWLLNYKSLVSTAPTYLSMNGLPYLSGGDGDSIEFDVITTGPPANFPSDVAVLIHIIVFPDEGS